MNAILKSGTGPARDRVRQLAAVAPLGASAADRERDRLAVEVETLVSALAGRDEAIACHDREVERAFEAGMAEGREAGLKEADDRSAERLAKLEDAAAEAVARFAERLVAMERLALVIARTCLERMLLASEERRSILAELIQGRVAALSEGAVVAVQVSEEDVGGADSFAQLRAGTADNGYEILVSKTLQSGDCRIGLQLGTLDVGLDQQWGAMRAELDLMIGAGSDG